MIVALTLSEVLRPTKRIADHGPKLDLEAVVPRVFGDWHSVDLDSIVAVNPQQKEVLDRIYSQTLSRTYINTEGYRVMLAIAYGSDQSDTMQVHKPEVCYPAQGFEIHNNVVDRVTTPYGEIAVRRLIAVQRHRREPLTYWITTGDQIVSGQIGKKLAELSYGLRGQIPDGMLVRVSSIDNQDRRAFSSQDEFLRQLLAALDPETRSRLSTLSYGKQHL